jgi:hypothetical protein
MTNVMSPYYHHGAVKSSGSPIKRQINNKAGTTTRINATENQSVRKNNNAANKRQSTSSAG